MGRTKQRAWRTGETLPWRTGETLPKKPKASICKRNPIYSFQSNYKKQKYNTCTPKRKLFMERGFKWSESNSIEFPDTFTQVIRTHKWETFCQNPSPASIPLVREFYANYDVTKPDAVNVRGKIVDTTSSAINSLFSLTDHENTIFEVAYVLSLPTIRDIAKELTGSQSSYLSFGRDSLKVGLDIWFDFVKHNLLPLSHDTIVQQDVAVLLYCIVVGKSINVGKVIAKQIAVCAGQDKCVLWFPALITRLCERHNVLRSDVERVQQPYSPLSLEIEPYQETSQSDRDIESDQEMSQSDHEIESDQQTSQSVHEIESDEETSQSDHESESDQQTSQSFHEIESAQQTSQLDHESESDQQMSQSVHEIESDEETNQSDHDCSSPVINVSSDDGDEKLLNLEQEQQELVKNESLASNSLEQSPPRKVSSPQRGVICVQGYNVKDSVAPILEAIFKKHGDIAAECVAKTASVRSSFLEVICEAVRQIQTDDAIEKIEEIGFHVSHAEAANIDVSWLQDHLEAIRKQKEVMKKFTSLMEMKANTILVKKAAQVDLRESSAELFAAQVDLRESSAELFAAQVDLRESSAELFAAQEQFEKAERCARVLRFVEKKLDDTILELKAAKDSWEKQPII